MRLSVLTPSGSHERQASATLTRVANVEVRLLGMAWGVEPLPDGGKQIVLFTPDNVTAYVVPFSDEGTEELVHLMEMENEHLEHRNAEARKKAEKAEKKASAPDG